jgi:precorrin-6B methylase 1
MIYFEKPAVVASGDDCAFGISHSRVNTKLNEKLYIFEKPAVVASGDDCAFGISYSWRVTQ